MKGVYIMGEKTEFINGCPICHHQGKMSLMEGVNGENYIICPVHGIISNKFWHDIFIDLSWAESISPTQPLIDKPICLDLLLFHVFSGKFTLPYYRSLHSS
jgi:hypothetical protein